MSKSLRARHPRPPSKSSAKPAMKDIPPSAIAPAPKPAAAAKPAPPPAPEPVVSNNQDDIDAMLASLDAATPEGRYQAGAARAEADAFELTDEMAVLDPAPAAAQAGVVPQDRPAGRPRIFRERGGEGAAPAAGLRAAAV